MPDQKTVYLGDDGDDVIRAMFLADRAADLSSGTLYAARWIQNDHANFRPLALRLARRELGWINVTAHPTAIAQQITEAFPSAEAPRYLIRDRDVIYGAAVPRRLRAMGIRDKPIAPGSPWQNGFVERLIGSIRRECVDHILVLGETHLRRTLQSFARYYNESRVHRSLNKDAPFHRAIERLGVITSTPVLGGLHHQYCRI